MQALRQTTVPIVMKDEQVELRMTEVGEMTVSFIQLAKGTDLGPALVGLDGDHCPCPHWGYMLEGQLMMRSANGHTRYRAGDAFYWAPGHVPVAIEDCRYVDFSPTAAFHHVIRHLQRG
jgi:hypothetical protein